MSPDQPLPIGTIIADTYTITGVLGEGGFATIYEGYQRDLDRLVAIKVLDRIAKSRGNRSKEDESTLAATLARFKREATVAAGLNHPNIVTIYAQGVTREQQPFIVMEFLEGHDLGQELETHGPLSIMRAKKLLLPCIDAVAEGHRHGIIHKDLKPSNIFIVHPRHPTKESVRIFDYGVARLQNNQAPRLTLTGMFMGTPQYMAPEYIKSEPISPAVDVYQMGLIVVEVLTGIPPVDHPDPFQCLMAHCDGNLNIPKALLETPLGPILSKALARDPKERYPDGRAFRDAISNLDPHTVFFEPSNGEETEDIIEDDLILAEEELDSASEQPTTETPEDPVSEHETTPSIVIEPEPELEPEPPRKRPWARLGLVALLMVALLVAFINRDALQQRFNELKNPTTAQTNHAQQPTAPAFAAEREQIQAFVDTHQWDRAIAAIDRLPALDEFAQIRAYAREEKGHEQSYKAAQTAFANNDPEAALKHLETIPKDPSKSVYTATIVEEKLVERCQLKQQEFERTLTESRWLYQRRQYRAALVYIQRAASMRPSDMEVLVLKTKIERDLRTMLSAMAAQKSNTDAPKTTPDIFERPTATPYPYGPSSEQSTELPVVMMSERPKTREDTKFQRAQLLTAAFQDNAKGHYESAIQKARLALKLGATTRSYRVLAVAHEHKGDLPNAIIYYNRLLKLDCSSRLATSVRAKITALGGKPEC